MKNKLLQNERLGNNTKTFNMKLVCEIYSRIWHLWQGLECLLHSLIHLHLWQGLECLLYSIIHLHLWEGHELSTFTNVPESPVVKVVAACVCVCHQCLVMLSVSVSECHQSLNAGVSSARLQGSRCPGKEE